MPIYDWDYVQRYADNYMIENTKPIYSRDESPPIEHYFISFNEFENKQEDEEEDNNQIIESSFKGKIE